MFDFGVSCDISAFQPYISSLRCTGCMLTIARLLHHNNAISIHGSRNGVQSAHVYSRREDVEEKKTARLLIGRNRTYRTYIW